MTSPAPGTGRGSAAVPPPLTVAASVAGLEAGLYVLFGLSILPSAEGERLVLDVSVLGFFLLYGGFVGFAAWQLWRLQSWARAPLVLAQLIQVIVGAQFWGTLPAVAVAAVALGGLCLAGIFHPASLAALADDG